MTRNHIQHVRDTIFNQVFNQGKAGLWPIGRPAAIDVAPSNGRFHSQDSRGARP